MSVSKNCSASIKRVYGSKGGVCFDPSRAQKRQCLHTPFPPIHTGHTVEPTLKPNDITDPGHEWALQSRGWVTAEPGRKKAAVQCWAKKKYIYIFGCVSPIKCDSVWTLMTEGRQLCLLKPTLQSQYSLVSSEPAALREWKGSGTTFVFSMLCTGWGKFCTDARSNLLLYLGDK